jgi:hypothetical protein
VVDIADFYIFCTNDLTFSAAIAYDSELKRMLALDHSQRKLLQVTPPEGWCAANDAWYVNHSHMLARTHFATIFRSIICIWKRLASGTFDCKSDRKARKRGARWNWEPPRRPYGVPQAVAAVTAPTPPEPQPEQKPDLTTPESDDDINSDDDAVPVSARSKPRPQAQVKSSKNPQSLSDDSDSGDSVWG